MICRVPTTVLQLYRSVLLGSKSLVVETWRELSSNELIIHSMDVRMYGYRGSSVSGNLKQHTTVINGNSSYLALVGKNH